MKKILLQTTITYAKDDWSIERFSMLAGILAAIQDDAGNKVSFHHFLDYNLDPRTGCPSFVTEASGSGMLENSQALADTKAYIENIARWLAE